MPLFLTLLALALPVFAAKNMEIYFVDVEGGQATLVKSPEGESILFDTGWPGFENRDANRIAAAAQKAGISKIDYLVITHFHTDHVGGLTQLAAKLPIANLVDHGKTVESNANADKLYASYEALTAKAKRITVKPGDKLPVKGFQVEVLAAHGAGTKRPGKVNSLCSGVQKKDDDPTDNAQSVGMLITYGKFRFLDLGDLTWNKELELVCPENRIGKVDLYLTTHHGTDSSGPAALVHAIAPTVAVMNNGEKKGGSPAAWKVIRQSPGLKDLWQLHYSAAGGTESNTDEKLIANLKGEDHGNHISVTAQSSGKFTVTNTRNGVSKSY
ncbi:MAG: MBL fold metallo-hydrolase [Bryobacteraceae bacterium]